MKLRLLPLCLALLLAAPLAAAQPAEADRARALYLEGEKAYQARRYDEARTAYLAAFALKKHWQIAVNLGAAELKVGRHRDAAEHLAFGLREGKSDIPANEVAAIRASFEEAKARVAEVRVTITPEGADVSVDGTLVGKSPLPDAVYVDAGRHVIEAKAVGYVARREELQAVAGSSPALALTLDREGAQVPPPPPPPPGGGEPVTPPPGGDTSSSGKSVPLIIAGAALGAAGIGLGVGLLAASGSAASDRDAEVAALDGDNQCAAGSPLPVCEEIESLDGDAKTFGAAGAVSLAVGGTVAVATLIYALWPEDAPRDAARIVPVVSPSLAGATFSTSF